MTAPTFGPPTQAPAYSLQQAPAVTPGAPQASFSEQAFETLVRQKGYPVQIDQALQCPCAGESASSARADCEHCGGFGWHFLPGTQTVAVLSGMGQSKRQVPWTLETKGTASVTVLPTDKLAFMDRLTFLHATTIFSQRLYPHQTATGWEAYATYPVKQLLNCLAYDGPKAPLRDVRAQLTTTGNRLTFAPEAFDDSIEREPAFTLRYRHHPVYHVLDIPRDLIESPTLQAPAAPGGRPAPTELPLHAMVQRAHFVFGQGRTDGQLDTPTQKAPPPW